jgi:hypothetical protein
MPYTPLLPPSSQGHTACRVRGRVAYSLEVTVRRILIYPLHPLDQNLAGLTLVETESTGEIRGRPIHIRLT